MRKIILFLLVLIASFELYSDYPDLEKWQKENPNSLPHWMTPEEELRKDEIGRDFYETDPPEGDVRNIAEFEPMEGVLIRYPFGLPYAVIAEMSEDIMVTTIVANQSQENTVRSHYSSNGVNLDNCNFLHAPSDSYWTRDYGPWYIAVDNDVSIVNFPYNRPRPNDNDIPIEMAEFLGVDLYGMNIIHTGGNYMTDEMGISASSELVWDENPSQSHTQIAQKMENYLGITTYHVVPDPNNTYIDHIDCWGKFLDVDKVLIRSVPSSHAQYDEIEETAAYFESQTSSYGTTYEVYRVYTPNNQPYTNSLILNNKVLVPITGSSWDDDAIATYQEAMPGYEILGFSGSWQSTDALHCRAKGVADRAMLYIHHIPISGNAPIGTDYEIEAELISYSNEAITNATVYYKVNGGNYSAIPMNNVGGNTYSGTIPSQSEGSEIAYYISAIDESGDSFSHPFIGAPDPHIFYVGGPVPPELSVNPTSFDITMAIDETFTEILDLSNIGGGIIEYTIDIQNATGRSIDGSTLTCSAAEFNPGETVTWTFTATCQSNDSEWIKNVYIQFPNGATVNSATDFVGGSGGDIPFNGPTGDGVNASWLGTGTWGNIYPDESATADVNLTINAGFVGDITLNYQLDGDIYGDEPHTVYGNITVVSAGPPITWITINQTEGELSGGETDYIDIIFNSNDIEFGTYTCDIVITDDRRNETIIPVILTVSDDEIIYGDVNGDGEVQAYDAALTLQFSAGIVNPDFQNEEAADVDDDGTITAFDAALILQYSAGLIDEFPVEGK